MRRATPPWQPPQPLRGRLRRNQLLLPRLSPARRAPSTRSSRCVLSQERARARLRALAGPQALQHHAALPGASATHQGRCAARPLSRSRPHPRRITGEGAGSWCSQQRGVSLQGAPGGTSASVPVHSQPLAEAARLASLSCVQPPSRATISATLSTSQRSGSLDNSAPERSVDLSTTHPSCPLA